MRCTRNAKLFVGAVVLMLASVIPVNDIGAQDADATTLGRDTYEEFCGACHGYDGVPLLPGAPAFSKGERLEKPDAELLRSIGEGKGDLMPPWKDILSAEERVAILRYVRGMAGSSE